MPGEPLDERGILDRVRHREPLHVDGGRDLGEVPVERLFDRARGPSTTAREEDLVEDGLRHAWRRLGEQRHRRACARVGHAERRRHAQLVHPIERVEHERQWIVDHAQRSQCVDADEVAVTCSLHTTIDVDPMSTGALHAMARPQFPHVRSRSACGSPGSIR